MEITKFIWKYFFTKLIKDNHPAVYQYIKGGYRSKETAVMRITEEVYEYCNPYWMGSDSFDITLIRSVSREYLKNMNEEYNLGNITIQEIYRTGL